MTASRCARRCTTRRHPGTHLRPLRRWSHWLGPYLCSHGAGVSIKAYRPHSEHGTHRKLRSGPSASSSAGEPMHTVSPQAFGNQLQGDTVCRVTRRTRGTKQRVWCGSSVDVLQGTGSANQALARRVVHGARQDVRVERLDFAHGIHQHRLAGCVKRRDSRDGDLLENGDLPILGAGHSTDRRRLGSSLCQPLRATTRHTLIGSRTDGNAASSASTTSVFAP